MSFPIGQPPLPNVWMTNLTGRYVKPDGKPAAGVVLFTPPRTLVMPNSPLMGVSHAEVELDFDGQFSVWLLSTDNPAMSPQGWTYRVSERLDCGPKREYNIFLVHDPEQVDIAQLAPSAPYHGRFLSVVGATGATGPQGPVGPTGPAGSFFNSYNGVWDDEDQYAVGDLVSFDGSVFMAQSVPPVGQAPRTDASWTDILGA